MLVPLYALTATQASDYIKNNSITVEDYAKSLLARVDDRDGIVKAWSYIDRDLVLKQARALDKLSHRERGPLHGIAIGIKDVMNTKDMPTEFGSPIYKGNRPGMDSSAVAILRAAGALIFGKTVTTEFTVLNTGPDTTNPHDPNRTPGGSSCGSAAAVADFHVPLSLGAQTGGSIIRPASFTGTWAMKPTYNAFSAEGSKAFAPTLDTLGFFSRSLEDLQLLADVFAIKDDVPPREVPINELSIALVKTPNWGQAGPGTRFAMEKAASILKSHGVEVEEVSLPEEVGDEASLGRILKVLTSAEAGEVFLKEYKVDFEGLSPRIRRHVENQGNFTKSERTQAFDKLANLRPFVDRFAASYSAIITPSAVDEAPVGLEDMGSPAFNTLWTGFHVPVIQIPAFVGTHGMPIGLSIVAARYCDQHLLKISKILAGPLSAEGDWKQKL